MAARSRSPGAARDLALENRCPHQGGPLGEGSIENGWLRCPWHGYDYDPLTGRSPEGFPDGALLLLGPSPAVQVGGLLPHLRGQVLGFEPARARLSPCAGPAGLPGDPLVPTISRSTPNTVQLSPGWFWTAGLPRASYLLVRCQ